MKVNNFEFVTMFTMIKYGQQTDNYFTDVNRTRKISDIQLALECFVFSNFNNCMQKLPKRGDTINAFIKAPGGY